MGALVRTVTLIAGGLLCAGLVTGCNSDGSGDVATDSMSPSATDSTDPAESASADPSPSSEAPSETPAPASWPACTDAWVAGANLPKPYDGCADAAGLAVPAESLHCSMGAVLVIYDDSFWGVPGHVISQSDGPLTKDPKYRQARATCTA